MYKKLNITENHLQVLSLFTKGYDKSYYIREVQQILKISPRTAQLILEDLEDKAVIESQIKGKIKTYKIKKNMIAKEYFIMAEQHKKISFLERHDLIREVMTKITHFIDGIAVIFGSYAKGTEKKDSDLDIFIAGYCDKNKIREISKLYGIEINIKRYSMRDFKKHLKNDILLREILDNHIIILNTELFVNTVFGNE